MAAITTNTSNNIDISDNSGAVTWNVIDDKVNDMNDKHVFGRG